jgi:hypothetical protein
MANQILLHFLSFLSLISGEQASEKEKILTDFVAHNLTFD